MKRAVKAVLFVTSMFLYVNASGDFQPCQQWTKQLSVASSFGPALVVPLSHDAGYAVAGTTGDMNECFFLLVTDRSGNEAWHATYSTFPGGSVIGVQYVHSVVSLADGGFVLAGSRNVCLPGSQEAAWVLRTNAAGKVLWTSVFGANGQNPDSGFSAECILPTPFGHFFVSGRQGNSPWMCCLDAKGSVVWSHNNYTGSSFTSLSLWLPDHIAAAGISWENSLKSLFINLTEPAGICRTARVSSTNASGQCPNAVLVSPYRVVYTAVTDPANGEVVISSYDANADLVWEKSLYFRGSGYSTIRSLTDASDGGILAAGDLTTDPYTAPQGIWLTLLDSRGNIAWQWITYAAHMTRSTAAVGEHDAIIVAEQYSPTSGNLVLMKLTARPFPVAVSTAGPASSATGLPGARQRSPVPLFDVAGRAVCRPGANAAAPLPAGIYFDRSHSSRSLFLGSAAR
jgi:hypothetical protein